MLSNGRNHKLVGAAGFSAKNRGSGGNGESKRFLFFSLQFQVCESGSRP
ncbi:hypothetical protein A2U01_0075011, partial [Trifolium medium]|nr:hypothetical protein [Trifolium medium]